MRYKTLLPIGLAITIATHIDNLSMLTPGISEMPAPLTADSTHAGKYQLPARQFTVVERST